MSVAQHAERLLAAWSVADPERFETELENAFKTCEQRAGANILEIEQREVLESIVESLRITRGAAERARRVSSAPALSAGFALLQHLSHLTANPEHILP